MDCSNALLRREKFAVSLRKKKKVEILKQKRDKFATMPGLLLTECILFEERVLQEILTTIFPDLFNQSQTPE